MEKLKLAILCGGQSAEHEISIISAKNVIAALDKNKYEVIVIFINRDGAWHLVKQPQLFVETTNPEILLNTAHAQPVALVFGDSKNPLLTLSGNPDYYAIDVAFPVLHGSHGEDGTVQGLLELANIAYVGPGVLGSAICMDKEVSKRLLQNAKIPIARFITFTQEQAKKINYESVVKKLGATFFVKPANTGSSVGISKVKHKKQFKAALDLAWQYENKILLEQYIKGREIECAVLGNAEPKASLPGEIIVHHEFYSYEAKYIDPNGATLVIPAKFPAAVVKKIQNVAKQAFVALACEGMARVDFFVTPAHRVYVNELNTIPGFTQISMYPKMWIASGLSYSTLLDRLIQLALDRFARNRVLVSARNNVANQQQTV